MINGTAVPPLENLDRRIVNQGEELYGKYCASCHGVNLEGAVDWKQPLEDGTFPAPPHNASGHTWHHPDFQLLEIIAKGGSLYDGSMPGFADQLSEQDKLAVLTFIKSSWGKDELEYQWWITHTYPTPTPMTR